jgi:curved DNA-binding protein CbpA
MAGPVDHYETLGVAADATADEIKKRYRTLARKLHPDVNPGDTQAAARFAKVADSYRVLGDPVLRTAYDAERSLAARAAARARSNPAGHASPSSGNSGRSTGPGTTPGGPSPAQEGARLVEMARRAFSQNRMGEAREFAERALRYTARNAAAHEVLGDVFRQQGRVDDALKHYTLSLQLNPRNPAVQTRLERVARESRWHAERAATSQLISNRPDKRTVTLGLVALAGYAVTTLLVVVDALFASGNPDRVRLGFPPIDTWTTTHLLILLASGAAMGFTQSVSCMVRRVEDDFLLTGGTMARPAATPVGILVLLVGAIQYLVAALIHLATSLVQETLHRSLGLLYGSVLAVTVCMSLSDPSAAGQTLLWGGNCVFVSHFGGRLLGDFFRSD